MFFFSLFFFLASSFLMGGGGKGVDNVCGRADSLQVGFLTEWQLYAQKIEGEAWKGERLDEGKVAKMSGMFSSPSYQCFRGMLMGWGR